MKSHDYTIFKEGKEVMKFVSREDEKLDVKKIRISDPCDGIENIIIHIIQSRLQVHIMVDNELGITIQRFGTQGSKDALVYTTFVDCPIEVQGHVEVSPRSKNEELIDKILSMKCFDKIRNVEEVQEAVSIIVGIN